MNLLRVRRAPFWAALGLCVFSTPAATASEIALFDADGRAATIDTEDLKGCALMFDAAGAPFEICRMEAVRIAPEATPRRRPGAVDDAGDAKASAVVYRRVEE